jgi:hypothetical protein
MNDFGLLVARFNTSAPTVSVDNSIRELRIDSGGRLHTRLTDDRDVSLRYFHDGEAVDGTVALDKGVLILGKNDTNSNYQALRVNDDGSLVVSSEAGTDISSAGDGTGGTYSATDVEGEVALTVGNWVLVESIAVATGKLHIDGWSFGSDKNCIFQLCIIDNATTNRAGVIEILDSQMSTSARPSDHVCFNRAISRPGGANVKIGVFAKQLQTGTAGVGLGMVNAHTTT